MQTCPKCRHIRRADETAPDWQCPACGVAYAKVQATAAQPVISTRADSPHTGANAAVSGAYKRLRWCWGGLVVLLLVWALLDGRASSSQSVATHQAAQQMSTLAAEVMANEVVMYTTNSCTYCHQAKDWLSSNGFAFTECNMDVDAQCEREFTSYGATGTPFLLVRGQKMLDGFDSDEFLRLLQ